MSAENTDRVKNLEQYTAFARATEHGELICGLFPGMEDALEATRHKLGIEAVKLTEVEKPKAPKSEKGETQTDDDTPTLLVKITDENVTDWLNRQFK